MGEYQIILCIAGTLCLCGLAVFFFQRKNKDLQRKAEAAEMLLKPIQSEPELHAQLNAVLDGMITVIRADGYYFYVLNPKSGHYTLRVSRHNHFSYDVPGPDYSGLAAYQKGKYSPPLGLEGPERENKLEIIQDGETPLLELSVADGKGLIRIGPIDTISVAKRKNLEEMGVKYGPIVKLFLEMDQLKNDVDLIKSTHKVIAEINQSVLTIEPNSKNMITLMSKILQAGGCALLKKRNGDWEIPVFTKITEEAEKQFRKDREAVETLYQSLGNKSLYLITPDCKEFYAIPYYFLASGIQAILVTGVEGRQFKGMAVFWYNRIPSIGNPQESFIKIMAKSLAETWDQQEASQKTSVSYMKTLRALIEAVDNVAPHTVGHSELIVRYAATIAKQMSLPDEMIETIKLAAFHHDIGMIALSSDLQNKKGKWNSLDYETIKIHPEIGSAVAEITINNETVAFNIRHHHERWDGLGYPDGLKGNQIPLGARIIAVADFFVAKIQGRYYRPPVTFERAITDLQAASGSQLDPEIVQALLSWFKKKQANPSRIGHSLGACWEMRCCPKHIYELCPAYQYKELNCWDVQGVQCSLHGNECSNCIVKTEWMYRKIYFSASKVGVS